MKWLALVLAIVLSSPVLAQRDELPLRAAERLLPRLPEAARLQLIQAWVRRGQAEPVRRLQGRLADPRLAMQGRCWLALLDSSISFPKMDHRLARQLLLGAPSPPAARRLLAAHPLPPQQLVESAKAHPRPEVAAEILRLARSLKATDADELARGYLALDDQASARTWMEGKIVFSPAVAEWLGLHERAEQLTEEPALRTHENQVWNRQGCAERVVILLGMGRQAQAEELMRRKLVGAQDLESAAERLKNQRLRLVVARTVGDEEHLALLQLQHASPAETQAIMEHVNKLGEQGIETAITLSLLNQLAPKTTRETYANVYKAADDSTYNCLSIEGTRELSYSFSQAKNEWWPSQVMKKVLSDSDPGRKFKTLVRLAGYYPSQKWPIVAEDLPFLDKLK
ncbi:MAG: hypothetical protein KF760_15145 [Candidatus Eremiobacteraeota bacterium]|nr:hypothetical protein [Candidatus Eremiobacteraeota bacterium]MCW5866374.1 hypothetical protein [Candidatus Eremiobacteraeota bacterium]